MDDQQQALERRDAFGAGWEAGQRNGAAQATGEERYWANSDEGQIRAWKQKVQDLQIKYKRLAEAFQPIYRRYHEEHAQIRLTERAHDPDCFACREIDRLYELLRTAEQEPIPEPLHIMEYRREHWPLIQGHEIDCSCTACWEYIAITEK